MMNSDMQEVMVKNLPPRFGRVVYFRPPGKKFTFRPTVGGKNQEAKQNSPPGFYHP